MNILNNNLGIEDRIWQELISKNVSCAKIVLTATGLNKSIIDASKTIRLFLIESGIHNFELQRGNPSRSYTDARCAPQS